MPPKQVGISDSDRRLPFRRAEAQSSDGGGDGKPVDRKRMPKIRGQKAEGIAYRDAAVGAGKNNCRYRRSAIVTLPLTDKATQGPLIGPSNSAS